MKKTSQVLAIVIAGLLALGGCTQAQPQTSQPPSSQSQSEAESQARPAAGAMEAARQAFLEKVDTEYSYNLANRLAEIRTNQKLGYRTAGSEAEIATGDLLKTEMESIGLKNVTKDEFTLDTWTFSHAELAFTSADGAEHNAVLGGYQTQFETDGAKEFAVVYAGQGTEADLAGLDVKDKLVLIDINQRENWWVNYPAYEAHLAGAAAILAAQDGGYSEVSPDALNAQDICGPADAPAFSISRTDADILKQALESAPGKTLSVKFDASSKVGFDGKSYNIVGEIPGKNPEKMILMSAHYDSYFDGFQDDNAAIALMFGIAKAITDSGYQPEKTLVFMATAAEEWGVSNTRYDWSVGAYNQIFRVHPEWVGKVIADINFELPAYSLGYDVTQIRTSYELRSFVDSFIPRIPAVEGAFPKGAEIIVPTQTWSDDFSLSIAGVPSSVTALRGDFAQKYYHSQFDDKTTYDEPAFHYHHNMYGLLMLAYDWCAVSPLDFSARFTAFEESIDDAAFQKAGVDPAPLKAAAAAAKQAAADSYKKIEALNTTYANALDKGDQAAADEVLADSGDLYAKMLAAFKSAEDWLVRLTWEDVSVFPHQLPANNLAALLPAIEALESGDATTALDEHLWLVDNNWYAYDFSYETYRYFTDYALNQPPERLTWGAGRLAGHEDLFKVIRSLKQKSETTGADFTEEIAALNASVHNQNKLMADMASGEIEALESLVQALNEMA